MKKLDSSPAAWTSEQKTAISPRNYDCRIKKYRPGTLRLTIREWAVHVRERVQGVLSAASHTPQCMFGSYSRA